MDPQAVIANARGEVDETLLTRTDGGLLGRNVLADRPLVAHLRDGETLHYLLAGAAPPARVEAGRERPVETAGSYRTLLAVTDRRLLVAAGSRDGDLAFGFPYGEVVGVDHDPGLLTDTVTVQETLDSGLAVEVASGSDPAAAVGYARDRLDEADADVDPGNGLVAAVFAELVGEERTGLDVEGYATGDLDELVEDLRAHHRRLRDHLDAAERDAARAAAATVEALAREGERLADERDRPEVRRHVLAARADARRAVVTAEFGLQPGELDGSPESWLRALLRAAGGTDFEHLIADVWSELGYRVGFTGSSRGDEVDVIARRTTPVEETVLVSPRRIDADAAIGRATVLECAERLRGEPEIDGVVVVTTGSITDAARSAVANRDVRLVDGERLAEFLRERDLYGVVAAHVVPG